MDEPFKGTNIKDAFDASRAILERFATKASCLFMFSSHLIKLSQHISDAGQINFHYFETEEGEGKLRFDYLYAQVFPTNDWVCESCVKKACLNCWTTAQIKPNKHHTSHDLRLDY